MAGDELDVALALLGDGREEQDDQVALAAGILARPARINFPHRSTGLVAYARSCREVQTSKARIEQYQAN